VGVGLDRHAAVCVTICITVKPADVRRATERDSFRSRREGLGPGRSCRLPAS
jgi:hypothetical protein